MTVLIAVAAFGGFLLTLGLAAAIVERRHRRRHEHNSQERKAERYVLEHHRASAFGRQPAGDYVPVAKPDVDEYSGFAR